MAETNPPFVFTITRVLEAPRELVWQAFTDPDRLVHWWGPKDIPAVHCDVDLREGGLFRYRLRTPDGEDIRGRFVYREIVEPERLVFVVSFTDAEGGLARHPWNPDWPLEILSTVTFAPAGAERTAVTVEWQALEPSEREARTFEDGRESMREGWTGTFDKLEAYLAGNGKPAA